MPGSHRVLVGVDGGGSGTRAVAMRVGMDGTQAVTGRARAGPCNIASLPLDEAAGNVRAALLGLGVMLDRVDGVCAAVAGYSHEERRREFSERLREWMPRASRLVAPDYAAALRGALPGGRGVLVIAGTGSIACAADPVAGREARAGGAGYLIDDAGSGYGIGREGIAAAMRALDGTGPATDLTSRIAAALRLPDGAGWRELVGAAYAGGGLRPDAMAALAPVVAAAAQPGADGPGDAVAAAILERAGAHLALLAATCADSVFGRREAGPALGEPPVALAGGVWRGGGVLRRAFERALRERRPDCVVTEPEQEPAVGAALLAADLLLLSITGEASEEAG